jgi:trans-aconitate methyltransferase
VDHSGSEESGQRFYGDLAPWWPLISPPAEYVDEAAFVAELINSAPRPVHEVLELGCGGGNNAAHLKAHFGMTLVDLSAEMLEVSRQLNPDCDHQQGDMRTVRLGRRFDAVFVHDAVDYMTTEVDLREAIGTAFGHCEPGGIAVFVPDSVVETFEPGCDHGGSDAADGRGARYLEWTWDPDPDDSWVLTEYAFVLRPADGSVRVVHETHRTGLFSRKRWLDLLTEAGFEPEVVTERTEDDRTPRVVFAARRPERPTP